MAKVVDSITPCIPSYTMIVIYFIYVTRSRKRGHFAQEFKIELLVLKGRVALKQ